MVEEGAVPTLQSMEAMGPVLSSITLASSSAVDLNTCTTEFSPAVTMCLRRRRRRRRRRRTGEKRVHVFV